MSTLTVRKIEVDLAQGFGRHWNGGDAYRTQLFNALSMSFPLGEQLFIDAVRAVPPECLTDPVLRAEVSDFIGQEATHRHVHVQYNKELERQGLPYTREAATIKRMRHIDRMGVLDRLAITCAIEHYTAMLADGVLRYPEWLDGAEPRMRTLWSWHAVEETEHKGVAFDACRAAGGGYEHVKKSPWLRCIVSPYPRTVFDDAPCPDDFFTRSTGAGSSGICTSASCLPLKPFCRLASTCAATARCARRVPGEMPCGSGVGATDWPGTCSGQAWAISRRAFIPGSTTTAN